MIKFLLKGLLRDRNRSLLPTIVVTLGVMITVFMHAYMNGIMGDSLEKNAVFNTGHLCVETKGYSLNKSQMPLDYALTGSNELIGQLSSDYPEVKWVERVFFAGLLDVPDSEGNTRVQGNITGMGLNLLYGTDEIDRMELSPILVKGSFPESPGEILISDDLFNKMDLDTGDTVTLISSTMYNEMAMYNFSIAGTLRFGVSSLDKGMILADIQDVRYALNMEDASSSVLGFFGTTYNNKKAEKIRAAFNGRRSNGQDQFSPVMSCLSDATTAGLSYSMITNMSNIIMMIFLAAMSIVLWNTGLISGLRRYGEFGLRLAVGQNKRDIYTSLIWEALLIGICGSLAGTILGLFIAWLMQTYGIDMTNITKNSSIMMSNIIRAKITPATYVIGFIPGILSTLTGALLAGIGVYKRQTANLFKELEN